jgi:hypothetical protein
VKISRYGQPIEMINEKVLCDIQKIKFSGFEKRPKDSRNRKLFEKALRSRPLPGFHLIANNIYPGGAINVLVLLLEKHGFEKGRLLRYGKRP